MQRTAWMKCKVYKSTFSNERVVELGETKGEISLGEVRELFSTSRKYTLALLEHMDRLQITRRVGDDRVLR